MRGFVLGIAFGTLLCMNFTLSLINAKLETIKNTLYAIERNK